MNVKRGTLVITWIVIAGSITPLAAADVIPEGAATLAKPVKNFQLTDVVGGKPHDLKSRIGQVVVLCWYSPQCGACPDYDDRINAFVKKFGSLKTKGGGKKVAFLAVSSNSMDTPADLKEYATDAKFNFPILRDGQSAFANHFQIIHNCTFVVIDQQGKFRYRGGLDDNLESSLVKQRHLENTVSALLNGKEIAIAETTSFG
ncbi:MAG: redoxin domain-containing protein [Planctomycetota bacterium]|nr:redoxin domain-containing protein [Planctomycetota bacterium]